MGPGLGTRRKHLDEEVPLDGTGTGATSIMFHMHLPNCAPKGHQHFLPRNDGTLSAIQHPLLAKELPLQLNGHHIRRRRGHGPINKKKLASRQRRKPRRVPTWSKDSPGRQQRPTRGGVHPCMTERRLAAIAVGPPAVGTSTMATPTSHRR